jgi:hypothetical protein
MTEDKPYPIIEEEDSSTLTANESASAVAYAEVYDYAESASIPGLPESWDDLLDCLKEGEEELEKGEYILWDVATKEMRSHIAEYAS